jgi:hypothetical protein
LIRPLSEARLTIAIDFRHYLKIRFILLIRVLRVRT